MSSWRAGACGAIALAGLAHGVASAQAQQAITLEFEARFGDQKAVCGQWYERIGSSDARVQLQDLRIYVSSVRLLTRDGRDVPLQLTPDGRWQSDKVALLDFEDASGNCNGTKAMNAVVRGVAPRGAYVGFAFDIGVPFDVNHADPTLASAPLNLTAMSWPWRLGYKFTSIDLETTSVKPAMAGAPGEPASGYSVHLGSTECGKGSMTRPPSAPCSNPNRASFAFPAANPARTTVVLDLKALLAASDVTRNATGSSSGCQSFVNDDDCAAIFARLGVPFRGASGSSQSFVRVVPR
jgi:uncharacterized repeat protein (TIGR04052 family)